jgi:hypothetical protein
VSGKPEALSAVKSDAGVLEDDAKEKQISSEVENVV